MLMAETSACHNGPSRQAVFCLSHLLLHQLVMTSARSWLDSPFDIAVDHSLRMVLFSRLPTDQILSNQKLQQLLGVDLSIHPVYS